MDGIQLTTEERKEHLTKHGFTAEFQRNHPEYYDENQLVDAAMGLCLTDEQLKHMPVEQLVPINWDLDRYERMITKPYSKRIIIAASLLVAHFDYMKDKAQQNLNKNAN